MDWDDIKIFLALIRTGTVRAAAEKLEVSHSTVGRRINALEDRLAARLFDRLPSGYVVTAVGEDVLRVAERVEEEMQGLERRVLGLDHKLSGSIRVTMVDALATHELMQPIAKFTHDFPEIDMQIETTYETADLDRRQADIAFRFAQHPPEHLVGRRLLICATAAYASRDYVDGHDLKNSDDARWIGFANDGSFPPWVKKSDFPHVAVQGHFPSLLVQIEACKAGMGIGMLPCFLCEHEPSLVRLSPANPDPNFELWILTHRDMRTNARIRVFSQFMADAIKRKRSVFEGTIDAAQKA